MPDSSFNGVRTWPATARITVASNTAQGGYVVPTDPTVADLQRRLAELERRVLDQESLIKQLEVQKACEDMKRLVGELVSD